MEKKILNLFLFNNKLKFNEIQKLLKIRSNKLAYHLKNLVKKQILIKKQNNYQISEAFEYLIPYISDKQAVLPVILIHIGNNKKALLYNRQKRPYKNYLSLPGGRFLIKESIQQATKRIMKQKFNLSAKLKKINSISLEQVKKSDKTIHSFLLIFVRAEPEKKQQIKLTNIKNNKSKIIPSDYKLLTTNLDSEIKIKTINSKLREFMK